MNILIVGSGYAGLNVYYSINKNKFNVKIISDSNKFKFYTLYFKKLINPKLNYIIYLSSFINVEKLLDVDMRGPWIKTDKNEYSPDVLVIATGCERKGLDYFLNNIVKEENIKIGSEYIFDEYLVLQLVFYLKALGKKVSYCGSPLSWLGKEVEQGIQKILTNLKVPLCEKPDFLFPQCEPTIDIGFLKTDEYLRVAKNCFAIGDIIYNWPKVGELAMREGIYVAKLIQGKINKPFSPLFVNIIDTGKGKGIHIRSNKLWGGDYVSIKYSAFRSLMKRFLEKYYVIRKGKMGFLEKL
jgi:NADH dehydrogenase FAD-containing subunit